MPNHWEIPHLASKVQAEPAVTLGSVTALVTALLALAASFGLHLSAEQRAAILTVAGIVGPLVSGFLTRRKVTPVQKES